MRSVDVSDLHRLQSELCWASEELDNNVDTIRTIFWHKETDQTGRPRDTGHGHVQIDPYSAELQLQLPQQGTLRYDNQVRKVEAVNPL